MYLTDHLPSCFRVSVLGAPASSLPRCVQRPYGWSLPATLTSSKLWGVQQGYQGIFPGQPRRTFPTLLPCGEQRPRGIHGPLRIPKAAGDVATVSPVPSALTQPASRPVAGNQIRARARAPVALPPFSLAARRYGGPAGIATTIRTPLPDATSGGGARVVDPPRGAVIASCDPLVCCLSMIPSPPTLPETRATLSGAPGRKDTGGWFGNRGSGEGAWPSCGSALCL